MYTIRIIKYNASKCIIIIQTSKEPAKPLIKCQYHLLWLQTVQDWKHTSWIKTDFPLDYIYIAANLPTTPVLLTPSSPSPILQDEVGDGSWWLNLLQQASQLQNYLAHTYTHTHTHMLICTHTHTHTEMIQKKKKTWKTQIIILIMNKAELPVAD